MSLRLEPTSKSLEKKLLIAGFEVPDVLGIFLILSILNFLLGSFGHKLLLVWGPTFFVAVAIRVGKRGKPDNFLIHYFKFKFRLKHLSAFKEASEYNNPPKLKGK